MLWFIPFVWQKLGTLKQTQLAYFSEKCMLRAFGHPVIDSVHMSRIFICFTHNVRHMHTWVHMFLHFAHSTCHCSHRYFDIERQRLDGLEWCKGKLTEEWMSGKWKRESWYMLLYISVQTQTEKDMKTYIHINLRAEWKTDMWQLKEAKEKERVCDKRRKRGRWKRKNVPLTFRWWFMGGSGFRQNSSKIIKWLQLKS